MEFLYVGNEDFETDKVHLAKYFQEYRLSMETVPNTIPTPKKKRKKKIPNEDSLLGKKIAPAEYKELSKITSLAKVYVPGEKEQIPEVYLDGMWYLNATCTIPNSCNLQAVNYLCERKTPQNLPYSNRIIRNKQTVDDDLRPFDDLVVVVHVYEPFKYTEPRRAGKLFAEIQILGKQTLADLKDRIICPKDLECPGEVSEHTIAAQGIKGKEIHHSSFIFVEDVFYCETRKPGDIDYSVEIKTWAESNGVKILRSKPMEKIKIESLSLRFGRPYVFVHMGYCEHLIIFHTARLMRPNDCLESGKYPLYTSLYRRQCKTCMMCQKIPAKWLVRECDRLVYDTAFLCAACFKSFLYLNGKKVGNFKAFVYVDRASVLA